MVHDTSTWGDDRSQCPGQGACEALSVGNHQSHNCRPQEAELEGPLHPQESAVCTSPLWGTTALEQAFVARLRRISQTPNVTAKATTTPLTMATYPWLMASCVQSTPTNPAADKPDRTGTRRGTAQHAAQAPASPRVVRRGFFIGFLGMSSSDRLTLKPQVA